MTNLFVVLCILFGSTIALPPHLQDAFQFYEVGAGRTFHDRIRREANGLYLLGFSQPSCTYDEIKKNTAENICRDELGMEKRVGISTKSSVAGVEMELLADEEIEDGLITTTAAPAEEQGFWKKAWGTIKKKAREFVNTMKGLWSNLKAKVVKVFDTNNKASRDSANKYMKLEQCVANKLSLSNPEGYPDIDAMIKLVQTIILPSGKELANGISNRMKSCIREAIKIAKEIKIDDVKYECLQEPACHAHYKSANCMKIALMENCMGSGPREF